MNNHDQRKTSRTTQLQLLSTGLILLTTAIIVAFLFNSFLTTYIG